MGSYIADVAQLNLLEPDQIDFANYSDGPKGYTVPAEGKYLAQLPIISDANFQKPDGSPLTTKAGYRKVAIDPITIRGGAEEGYEIKYTELSFKKYSNREGSQVLDLLRACGYAGQPQSNAEIIAALKMMSGRTFQFGLQWKCWDGNEEILGMDNPRFKDEEGNVVPWVVDPNDSEKRKWARGQIKFYVSAVKKTA